jgi:hypothetical protein
MSRWTYDSRRYRRALAEIQAAGPTCWLCGHGGSDSIDHAIPASIAPDLRAEPSNWRPAHGVRGCSTCGVKCQQSRGASLTIKRSPRSRRW